MDSNGGDFESIQDVIDTPNSYLCIEEAIVDIFVSVHPTAERVLLPQANVAKMLEAIENGDCVSAVMKKDAIDKMHAVDDSHCNFDQFGEVLLNIGAAFPVNKKYSNSLTYVVGKSVNSGSYENLREPMQMLHVGENQCGDEEGDGGSSAGFDKLGTEELLAPLLLTFACTTLGLFVFFWPTFVDILQSKSADDDEIHLSTKSEVSVETFAADQEHDVTVRAKLSSLKVSELIQSLQKCANVDHGDLSYAAEVLPNKTALVDLLLDEEGSQTTKEIALFKRLELYDLMELVSDSYDQALTRVTTIGIDLDAIVNQSADPGEARKNIINSIMTCNAPTKHRILAKTRKILARKRSQNVGIQKKGDASHFETARFLSPNPANMRNIQSVDNVGSTALTPCYIKSGPPLQQFDSIQASSTKNSTGTTTNTSAIPNPPGLNFSDIQESDSSSLSMFSAHQPNVKHVPAKPSPIHRVNTTERSSTRGAPASNFVYLCGGDFVTMAQRIDHGFRKKIPNSINSVKLGFMMPNGSNSSSDERIEAVKVMLNNPMIHLKGLVQFFLQNHDPTIETVRTERASIDDVVAYASYILTNDRKLAAIAKETLKEMQAHMDQGRCANLNYRGTKVHTFVGRAGAFIERVSSLQEIQLHN